MILHDGAATSDPKPGPPLVGERESHPHVRGHSGRSRRADFAVLRRPGVLGKGEALDWEVDGEFILDLNSCWALRSRASYGIGAI
jgi:hypothetical protein